MKALALIVAAVLAAAPLAHAQPKQPVKAGPVAAPVGAAELPALMTPRLAVELAHADASPIGLIDGAHQFYVYDIEPSDLRWDAVAYAINTAISHSVNLYAPARVAEGRLLRIDKRELCPNAKDRARLDGLLENVLPFFEPYTHRSDLVRGVKGFTVRVSVPPYKATDGKTYRHKLEPIRKEEQFAAHVGIDKMLGLYSLLGETNLPIVRADWFVCMILSTQKIGRADGIYYELRGWDVAKTTQDDILRELGAGEDQVEEQRLTLVQQISKPRKNLFDATSRALIFHSGVASVGERRVDAFNGTKVRPSAGFGIIFLTHDLDRKSVAPEQSPLQNLVLFADDGREGIGLLPNGMQAYWASNGQGKLVKSVPEGIAHDSTIPHPSPQTLEPGISCMCCHGPAEGYIPYQNDILQLSRERIPTSDPLKFDHVNVFDDDSLTAAGFSLDESIQILRGLFGQDPDRMIAFAQQQHGRAVAELTAGRKVAEVTGEIMRMRNYYVFGMVTAEIALAETGRRFIEPAYLPSDDPQTKAIKANERLKEIVAEHVPPLAKVAGRAPEHPTINALRGGRFPVTRAAWENVYADFQGRAEAEATRKKNDGKQNNPDAGASGSNRFQPLKEVEMAEVIVRDELFRSIDGYPGYWVGVNGDVLSQRGVKAHLREIPELWKRLRPLSAGKGYLAVDVRATVEKGAGHRRLVHSLVLNAFVGPCPEGHECRHLDGDRANNRLTNLAWGTYTENADDKRLHGTLLVGSSHPNAKLTESDVVAIRRLHAAGTSIGSLAREYRVDRVAVHCVVHRKTWKHVA